MTSLILPPSATPAAAWIVVRRHAVRVVLAARARDLTAPQLAALLAATLAVGIGVSITTTAEHDWWRLHFSELGTARDFSGDVFNGTLVVAGGVIAVFALRVRRDLTALAATGRRRPRLLIVLMVSGGGQLAVVGLVPVDTLTFLHDRAASGVMICFAAVLVSVGCEWRMLTPVVRGATAAVAGALAATTPVFLHGAINLAAFEAIGFSLIFVWLGVFTTALHADAARVVRAAD